MQIFTTDQVRAWDQYTILHEPVSSIDLMERAATACFKWLMRQGYKEREFEVFCGKGNNGGDGLALARMLSRAGQKVRVHILEFGHLGTEDFQVNLARLHETGTEIKFISAKELINPLADGSVVIDALYGSGLNRPMEGLSASLATFINASGHEVVSIDIPSGMFADAASDPANMVRARHTLSFQCMKLAFVVPENAWYTGEVHILDIGLHDDYLKNLRSPFQFTSHDLVSAIIRPRQKFSHKGQYGHGGLIAGSQGMMGAAVLAAKAFMRSGAGKLTCHVPAVGYTIMQSAVPEAMASVGEGHEYIESVAGIEGYDVIGIGPGLGRSPGHEKLIGDVLNSFHGPMVVDADALNVLSQSPGLLKHLPRGAVLTPHPAEFERLFGKAANGFERIWMAIKKAGALGVVIVLKGHFSLIATPGGACYFNMSGNPGMATAGSGDVLTGIIAGLLAQGYPAEQAAIAGVYIHGKAGDLAAARMSQASVIASDMVDEIGNVFLGLDARTPVNIE